MRKNLPLLVLLTVVVLVIGGYLGYTSLTHISTPPAVRDVKVPPAKIEGDVTSSNNKSDKGNNVPSGEIEKTNVLPVDPQVGEVMVWGEVKAVDIDRRVITIDQQMDDNSKQVSPNVPVNKDAVIRTKGEIISLTLVKPGDSAGLIITKDGQARAVLLNY